MILGQRFYIMKINKKKMQIIGRSNKKETRAHCWQDTRSWIQIEQIYAAAKSFDQRLVNIKPRL